MIVDDKKKKKIIVHIVLSCFSLGKKSWKWSVIILFVVYDSWTILKKQILSRWFEKGEDFSTTDSTATFHNSFFPIDFWEKEKEWEKVIRPLV